MLDSYGSYECTDDAVNVIFIFTITLIINHGHTLDEPIPFTTAGFSLIMNQSSETHTYSKIELKI